MRLHRFFFAFNPSHTSVKIADKDLIHQIKDVLRLTKGNEVILADGKNHEAHATLALIQKEFVEFEIKKIEENKNEPVRQVTLYLSILKRENFELAAQKAVEAGVHEIVPLTAQRTVKVGFKKERLETIIKEAAEQSGRGIIPVLADTLRFEVALETAKKHDKVIFFDSSGLPFPKKNGANLGIFVGPEGGWGEEELSKAKSLKWEPVSLGTLTLRAETAAIVGTYLAVQL